MTEHQTISRSPVAFDVTITCTRCGVGIGGASIDPAHGDFARMSEHTVDIETDVSADLRSHAADAHGWPSDEDDDTDDGDDA